VVDPGDHFEVTVWMKFVSYDIFTYQRLLNASDYSTTTCMLLIPPKSELTTGKKRNGVHSGHNMGDQGKSTICIHWLLLD
jgi:hypothetical protein